MNLPLVVAIIGASLALISLCLCFVLWNSSQKATKKWSLLQTELFNTQTQISHLNDQLHELRSGALGVSNRVKELSIKTLAIQDKLEEVELSDPDTKLYAQAARLVDAGATVDELMRECDLPRAEAELLVSLRHRDIEDNKV